jgi:hypothetical protein
MGKQVMGFFQCWPVLVFGWFWNQFQCRITQYPDHWFFENFEKTNSVLESEQDLELIAKSI